VILRTYPDEVEVGWRVIGITYVSSISTFSELGIGNDGGSFTY